MGTYRRLTRTSESAKITLTGNHLWIVAWTCTTCGSFALYDGATKIATVSTYSSDGRKSVFSKAYASTGTHTYTIRPLGTSGRPAVQLDAFAMQR
jgi:hypothetical protein